MRTPLLTCVLCIWFSHTAGCAVQPLDSNAQNEVLVTFALPASSPVPHAGSQRSYRSGSHWDVDLATRQRAKRFARDYGLTLREGWPIDALGLYCVAYTLPPTLSLDQLRQAAKNRDDVHGIQTNTRFSGMGGTYDDPLFKFQFGEHAHRLFALHQHSMGKSVTVSIVDSAADGEHPDLIGQITRQETFAHTQNVADLSHGTAVTGVIAAAEDNSLGVVGLAPAAEVHVYGACRSNFSGMACDAFNMLKAIQAALDEDVQILNLSLAGPYDPLVDALINRANDQGIIVIAATNEQHPEANFPANEESVFSASGNLGLWFTHPEQMTNQAGGGYQVFKGTSISAAGMSGIAALLRAQMTEAQTRAVLTELQNGCTKNRPRLFNNETCL